MRLDRSTKSISERLKWRSSIPVESNKGRFLARVAAANDKYFHARQEAVAAGARAAPLTSTSTTTSAAAGATAAGTSEVIEIADSDDDAVSTRSVAARDSAAGGGPTFVTPSRAQAIGHGKPRANGTPRQEWTEEENAAVLQGVRTVGRSDHAGIHRLLPPHIRAQRTKDHIKGRVTVRKKTPGAADGKGGFLERVAHADAEFRRERAAAAASAGAQYAQLAAEARGASDARDRAIAAGRSIAQLAWPASPAARGVGIERDILAGAGADAGPPPLGPPPAGTSPPPTHDILRVAAETGILPNAGAWRGADGAPREQVRWTPAEDKALRAAVVGVAREQNSGPPPSDHWRAALDWDARHGRALAVNGRTPQDLMTRVRYLKAIAAGRKKGQPDTVAAARAYHDALMTITVGITRPTRDRF
jgi:hypothetical protein